MVRRWTQRALGLIAVLVVGSVGAVWWLFYDNPSAEGPVFPIDLAAIRKEASRLPGEEPIRIEAETVSHDAVPRIAMVAGAGWGKVDLVRVSYRLVFPAGSIVVDTGYDEATARQVGADRFDRDARARIIGAMDQASAIIVTHEHGDHLGGLKTSPNLTRELRRALLTPEQLTTVDRSGAPAWPAGTLSGYRALRYMGVHAVAPGVVLVRAPGHTPGSQMVYVRRADGREFLLVGDVASMADNVTTLHIRSRYVTDHISHDDRSAVMAQTRALHALALAHPALVIVPGHDGPTILRLEHGGLLVPGFSLKPPAPIAHDRSASSSGA